MKIRKRKLCRPRNERGIALVIVMFLVLTMSLVGASLMMVSRGETMSTLNYQTVSQTRYAAESGIAAATNYILNSYTAPTVGGADNYASYTTTTSPVQYNGAAVVLSSDPSTASNYPVAADVTAFNAAATGTLSAGTGNSSYYATATLISMRQITDGITGTATTLQTWQIAGKGTVGGAGSASVQVSAILEQQDKPVWQYAAFSTNNGCNSLTFGGNSHTDSYNSASYSGSGSPSTQQYGGNIGTNGNLDDYGSSSIAGTLSTPRSGVGACSANNVTALATVSDVQGLVPLSQPVSYPSPGDPNPLPPTTSNDGFTKNGGCPAGITGCSSSSGGATIHPATSSTVVTLDNVSIGQNCTLHLGPGIYVVNSISNGGTITVDSNIAGSVVIKVAGQSNAAPISLSGGNIDNSTYDPSKLEFIYNGTGTVTIGSNADSAALMYAPNATVNLSGNGDFYGAIIAGTVSGLGTSGIHYDRNLQTKGTTAGNPVLDQFTWKNY